MTRGGRGAFAAGVKWFLAAGWSGIIWTLLTLPSEKTPDIGFIPLGDKLGHVALYCVWSILICWAANTSLRALSVIGIRFLVVLAAIVYGSALEVYQAGIGRDMDIVDIIADALGAVAGQWFFFSPKAKAAFQRTISKTLSLLRRSPARPAPQFKKPNSHDAKAGRGPETKE